MPKERRCDLGIDVCIRSGLCQDHLRRAVERANFQGGDQVKALTGDGVAPGKLLPPSGAEGQAEEELQSRARGVAEERGHCHTEAVALGRGSQALPRGPARRQPVGTQHCPCSLLHSILAGV